MLNYLRKLRAYKSTYAELSRLSARELADIGITAGDIKNVARQSYDMA